MLVFTGVHIFLLLNGEYFHETQPNPDANSFFWRHFPNPKSQKHVFFLGGEEMHVDASKKKTRWIPTIWKDVSRV